MRSFRGHLVALLMVLASAAYATPRRPRTRATERSAPAVTRTSESRRSTRGTSRTERRTRERSRRTTRARTTRARPAPRRTRPVVVQPPLPGTPRPAVGTPSPGCRAVAASHPRGVSEQTLAVGDVTRTYLLSVPNGYAPHAGPVPLVFAFHGLTGTPTSLRSYLRVEREAAGGAIFVYPAGQRATSRDGRLGNTRWDLRASGADVAFFDALHAHLGRTYCVDLGRVYAVGHSAGAVMTNAIACHRGNALRAAAPIAGSGPSSRQCAAPPSVWITHGRADEPVLFQHGEATRDHWVAAAHCTSGPAAVEGASCVRYTGCDEGASVVFCPHEGDHSVPAFAPREIWSFFARQGAR